MIPLRDNTYSHSFPFVNVTIIVLNVLIFLYQQTLPEDLSVLFYYNFGVIPAQVISQIITGESLLITGLPFVTCIFLHGSWLHLLGNMLYLWIFGDNVEDRIGHFRYLLFYLLIGIISSIAHIISVPESQVPIIGASGAIAGVMGAYLITFPKAKILTLVPVFFFITFIQVPAIIYLPIWFIMQVISGLSTTGISADAVAWWAHIGGFIGGIILMPFFARRAVKY